ncbi:MAG: DNA-processing protein DprA [Muribaculaceae bacterium]|nr:DNA-processing protein DprA [Muribaculaceae bacterium]
MAFSFLKKRPHANFLREALSEGITPEQFFTLPTKELVSKLGISADNEFGTLAREEALSKARQEWEVIKKHNISPLFLLDEDYPSRLAETYDAPLVLYKLGEADLEAEHIVAVVGTRKPSPYGVEYCNRTINDLSIYFPDMTIVSGLAYGIDAVAHRNALDKELVTVAVVAHGLNMVYPSANRNLAKEIVRKGGAILSEYPFGTKPFAANFLARNRIVAGLSDVTLIMESKVKGGAMSTANYAFQYNREVMALPGKATDELSSGCNHLIKRNKAHLFETAADIIESVGWQPLDLQINPQQRNLFPELEGDNKKIYEILQKVGDPMQIDHLVQLSGIPVSKLLGLLNELEFDGIIFRHPGNRYSVS